MFVSRKEISIIIFLVLKISTNTAISYKTINFLLAPDIIVIALSAFREFRNYRRLAQLYSMSHFLCNARVSRLLFFCGRWLLSIDKWQGQNRFLTSRVFKL